MVRYPDASISQAAISRDVQDAPFWVQVLGSKKVGNLILYSWQEVTPWYDPTDNTPSFIFQAGGRFGVLDSAEVGNAYPTTQVE